MEASQNLSARDLQAPGTGTESFALNMPNKMLAVELNEIGAIGKSKRHGVWGTWRGNSADSGPVSSGQMRCPLFIAGFASALGLTAIGCHSLPPSKPASEWTPEEARGAAVFQTDCARCHYPTSTAGLHGPGLQAITKIKAMPSGAPPTDERLTDLILHGRQMMPPTQLDDAQLHDLLAYLHTL